MKGRAVVLKRHRQPFEIEEHDVPEPEPGAIVVRMTAAGICGSDLHTWRGDMEGRPLPASGSPVGHEGTGVVYALGTGVRTDSTGKQLREGDRVVFSAVYSCGRCRYCLNGRQNLCVAFSLIHQRGPAGQPPFFFGTYADFVYLPPNHAIFKAPDELSDEVLAPVNCAIGTVFEGLRQAGFRAGQRVVFQGAGGLGLAGIGIARTLGAAAVIAIDGQPSRLELAAEFGATSTIDINELRTAEERIERVREITGGDGADLVVELVGLGELVAEGLAMLAHGGTFLEIGNIVGTRAAQFYPTVLLRGRRIVGS
ncbi:MAG: alcohol dehydrogenase catalytic domain-containing protein, partial [Chloroflexota bacterium]